MVEWFKFIVLLLPNQYVSTEKSEKVKSTSLLRRMSIFGSGIGIFPSTAVLSRLASLVAHVGENSPLDCFLPQTAFAPSLFESLKLTKNKKHPFGVLFVFGSGIGIRTPTNRVRVCRATVTLSR